MRKDETGIVGIVLWDEQVDRVKTGDIIRIEGGWCRSRNEELVVSTGKNGRGYTSLTGENFSAQG